MVQCENTDKLFEFVLESDGLCVLFLTGMKEGAGNNTYSRHMRNILAFGAIVLVLFVLKVASEVTLPIALAIFIFAFINPLMEKLNRLKVPNMISIIIALALVLVIFFGFAYIIFIMANMLLNRLPYYAGRIMALDSLISSYIVEYAPEAGADFSLLAVIDVDWYGLATSWLASLSSRVISLFSDAMLIFVILLFILMERQTFMPKILFAFPRDKAQKFSTMLGRINRQISKYLMIKAIISLITGLFFYLTAIVTGLDFALVWGVLAVLLNFIPTIGSIVVTAMTIAMAIIQFAPGQWISIVYVAVLTISTQMILGNIIDPKLQGVQLNMSPLLILISLSLWGFIWGIPGMFLAVPIMSIVQIVCSIVPSLKPAAVLLSSGKNYIQEYRLQEASKRKRKKNLSEEKGGDIILPEGENPQDI